MRRILVVLTMALVMAAMMLAMAMPAFAAEEEPNFGLCAPGQATIAVIEGGSPAQGDKMSDASGVNPHNEDNVQCSKHFFFKL